MTPEWRRRLKWVKIALLSFALVILIFDLVSLMNTLFGNYPAIGQTTKNDIILLGVSYRDTITETVVASFITVVALLIDAIESFSKD